MTKNKIEELICKNETEVSQKAVLSIMKLTCYSLIGMDTIAKNEETELMLSGILAAAISGKTDANELYEQLVKFQKDYGIGEEMDVPEIEIPADWN